MELLEGKNVGTSSPSNVSTKQQRIAELAKVERRALTTLAHHIDIEWLEEAFRKTRKDGAPGTDGVTAAEYEQQLRANLQLLLSRAKSGTYRAPAVRRVFIPKGDGQQRPIGIPTFEDKVLQRAVHMVLEPVYEQEFHDCSLLRGALVEGWVIRLVDGPQAGRWGARQHREGHQRGWRSAATLDEGFRIRAA